MSTPAPRPNLLRRLAAALSGSSKKSARNFSGAQMTGMFADWFTSGTNADAEIRRDLLTLRNRCRSLERDNDYIRKYLSLLENNVIGSRGIALQMKILRTRGGEINEKLCGEIEDAWRSWTTRANCSLNRRQSWLEIQRVALRSTARDGECLIRLHRGAANPYAFALSLIEADHLDHTLEGISSRGNRIIMGVEISSYGEPTHYHTRTRHPGEGGIGYKDKLEAIPANDLIHLYRPDRPGQTRGHPWLSSVITRLRQLQEYEVAEVIAARVGACKMGFFTKQAGGEYSGEKNADGSLVMDAAPGSFEQLPEGVGFQPFTPDHPSTAYPAFVKGCLRGISSGLGIAYNDLANDLEGVNYSSIRAGLLEVREHYKGLQEWFIETACVPIFEAWLKQALLARAIPLGLDQFDRLNQPSFKGRRWPWVDPQADITAAGLAISQGFTSRRAVVAENGGDFWDVCADQQADEALAAEKGLSFPKPAIVQGVVNDTQKTTSADGEKPPPPPDALASADAGAKPPQLAPEGNGKGS